LAAEFAPLMVLVIWLRLEFYVRRNLKVVALVSLLFVNLTKRKMILYAIYFGKNNYEGGDPACWRRYSAGMCKCGVLCAGDEDAYVSEISKIVNKVNDYAEGDED
jgi:hypothetical protein